MTRKSKHQLERTVDRLESDIDVDALDDFAIGCWSVDTDGRLVGLVDVIEMNTGRGPDRRPDSAVPIPPSPDKILAHMEDPPPALDDALDDDDIDRRDPSNYINLPDEHAHLERDLVVAVESLIDRDTDTESDTESVHDARCTESVEDTEGGR